MANQHVLIIGNTWAEPNSSAAGVRMFQLIELFLKQDWKITYACAAAKTKNALDLSKHGIKVVSIELNSGSFDEFLVAIKPFMVVFDRFITEEQFGWRVTENCPEALKILDTEDLHCLRKTREKAVMENRRFEVSDLLHTDIAKREMASILRCDVSLIISPFEMELLQNTFKIDKRMLHYIPFMISPIKEETTQHLKSFEERSHFVFMGNFKHAPNADAVWYLKNHIWKGIREKIPAAELHIYGAYPTQRILQMHDSKGGFMVKGYVEDAESAIQSIRVMLAPLRFGAGIKGKFVQAILNGTP